MPKSRRKLRERTHNWQQIQQYTLWPEQKAYELLRPVVLFGETAAERAKETGASERTLHHKADRFDQEGMASLFHKESTPSPDKARTLPPDMRQLIVDLKGRVGGQRGAVWCFDLPETVSGGISASPFLTSPLRTGRAGFLAHGSPVQVFIPSSLEQDLRISRPAPSLVRRSLPVPLPHVLGITPIV